MCKLLEFRTNQDWDSFFRFGKLGRSPIFFTLEINCPMMREEIWR